MVNKGNMILLKQIPQRAVINNQEKDEPEDPEQDSKLFQAAIIAIVQRKTCTIHITIHIPFHLVSVGQMSTLLVEGGTTVMQANHI